MFERVHIDCQEMKIPNKVLLHCTQFMTHKKVSLKSADELRTINRREGFTQCIILLSTLFENTAFTIDVSACKV